MVDKAQKDNNKKVYSGFVGDLSPQMEEALNKFREYNKGLGLYKEVTDPIGTPHGVIGDEFLLRFLRARKFELDKTLKMYNEFLEWRKLNEVDRIMSDYVFSELAEVRQFYPHGYHKTDKQGRPIYIERIGQLKLQQLFQITSEDRLIKYYIQSYEVLLNRIFLQCSKKAGRRIEQTLTILDLKGTSMKMISRQVYNFIKIASTVAQNNYPEILGRMFIINAPMLFSGVWAVIKPWLDEKTKNKITIIGSGYKDKLAELIDNENLPEFLGGTCNCDGFDCLERNIGVWNLSGKDSLFPGEPREEEEAEEQKQDEPEEEENQEQLESLRNALMGINLSKPQTHVPHNPNKYDMTTQGNHVPSDTPLNTQIDADDNDNDNQQVFQHYLEEGGAQ